MSKTPKLVTEPHNPYLLETFRAFAAEGLPVPVAVAMTQAHLQHQQNLSLQSIARSLASLQSIARSLDDISGLVDPCNADRFIAILKAAAANRTKNKEAREVKDSVDALGELLKESSL